MTWTAISWLLWFVLSLGIFIALEAHAVVSPALDDTLSAQVKRLTRHLTQPGRALFLALFVGGFAILGAHFNGWLW